MGEPLAEGRIAIPAADIDGVGEAGPRRGIGGEGGRLLTHAVGDVADDRGRCGRQVWEAAQEADAAQLNGVAKARSVVAVAIDVFLLLRSEGEEAAQLLG